MKIVALLSFMLTMSAGAQAQSSMKTVSASELQALISLPSSQAVAARAVYKNQLRAASDRQTGAANKECEATSGQQPYNVCIGKADETADGDLAIFYNNLQMLCHSQDELLSLQLLEKQWKTYSDCAMKAVHVTWPDDTGAPGFAGQVYLSLVREHMRQLTDIYGLDITQ